jgi:hypothetical protein
MIRPNNNSAIQSNGTSIVALFFLIIAMFLLTGFLPQYLTYLEADGIELSESFEDETEEKKEKEKEKETEKEADKYQNNVAYYALIGTGNLITPDGYFHRWQNPSADVITPPPDCRNS